MIKCFYFFPVDGQLNGEIEIDTDKKNVGERRRVHAFLMGISVKWIKQNNIQQEITG